MFQVWVRDAFEFIIRGVEFANLEDAQAFSKLCEKIEGATEISVEQNGEEIYLSFKKRDNWS